MMKKALLELGLNEEDIYQVESAFTEKITLQTGDYLVKEGQILRGMGFITQGAFRHYYHLYNGDEVTRWVSLENNFVTSLLSFIARKPSVENIQAIKNAEILFAPIENLEAIFSKNSKVNNIWCKQMANMYLGMEERVYQLIALKAEQRYRLLCQNQPAFVEQVPDKYLASMLGVTARHLSRLRGNRNRQLSSQ